MMGFQKDSPLFWGGRVHFQVTACFFLDTFLVNNMIKKI